MRVAVRRMSVEDTQSVGRILTRAFNEVFDHHGYPPPFASERDGIEIAQWYYNTEPEGSFVAEIRNQIVGGAFLHRRGKTASIGPVAVDPQFQNLRLGWLLMEHLLAKAADCPSVRLFQDAFNTDSFALYAKMGFRAVDIVPIVVLLADAATAPRRWPQIRTVGIESLELVADLDQRLTGISRSQDLRYLLETGVGFLVRGNGSETGYLCAYSSRGGVYVGPAAAHDDEKLYQLLQAVRGHYEQRSMVFRLPARQSDLLQRLLREGYRLSNLGTLMVRGEWTPPAAAELLAVFPESL